MRAAAVAGRGRERVAAPWHAGPCPAWPPRRVLLAVVGAALGGSTSDAATRTAAGSAAGSLLELASDSTPAGGVALLAVMAY